MDSAFWSGLGCVAGLLVPIVVGIVALTWSFSELRVMFVRWIARL